MNQLFKKYINKENQSYIPVPKYKTNFTNCINEAFANRNYRKTDADDWDIIWSEKQFIADIYASRLNNEQRVNHFRNYQQLCKKDQLIKNLKKHKKNLEREGKVNEANMFNFYPQTFVLPHQYVIFSDQFKRMQTQMQAKNIWIMKPTGKSQGKGIFLVNRLAQTSSWDNQSAQPYIAQRYIADPLLIGGKKFDLRLYVLVTSYSPLTVYAYRGGFARFTHCRYDQTKIQNSQIHLTNVAIQKTAEGYDQKIGGKWYLQRLKQYLLSKFGQVKTNQCFLKIQDIFIKTLQAVQKMMVSQKPNAFQLYGFDVLLNSKLQPFLIEVNGSPSMTANTEKDHEFKCGLLDDALTILDLQKFLLGNEQQIGGFDIVCRGVPPKNKGSQPKRSFLGSLNNRYENIKKMAKNYAPRLNQNYTQQRQIEKKRVNSVNYPTPNPSKNTSKQALANRKYHQISRPLMGSNANILNSSGTQNTRGKAVVKDFVIKQKKQRQNTSENQSRC